MGVCMRFVVVVGCDIVGCWLLGLWLFWFLGLGWCLIVGRGG